LGAGKREEHETEETLKIIIITTGKEKDVQDGKH